ncbi:hypothetical protein FF38_06242, partial [Lucilia cuprina]
MEFENIMHDNLGTLEEFNTNFGACFKNLNEKSSFLNGNSKLDETQLGSQSNDLFVAGSSTNQSDKTNVSQEMTDESGILGNTHGGNSINRDKGQNGEFDGRKELLGMERSKLEAMLHNHLIDDLPGFKLNHPVEGLAYCQFLRHSCLGVLIDDTSEIEPLNDLESSNMQFITYWVTENTIGRDFMRDHLMHFGNATNIWSLIDLVEKACQKFYSEDLQLIHYQLKEWAEGALAKVLPDHKTPNASIISKVYSKLMEERNTKTAFLSWVIFCVPDILFNKRPSRMSIFIPNTKKIEELKSYSEADLLSIKPSRRGEYKADDVLQMLTAKNKSEKSEKSVITHFALDYWINEQKRNGNLKKNHGGYADLVLYAYSEELGKSESSEASNTMDLSKLNELNRELMHELELSKLREKNSHIKLQRNTAEYISLIRKVKANLDDRHIEIQELSFIKDVFE